MFDHVTIYVPDRDASERFFETVLIPLGIETTYRTNAFAEWDDFSIMQVNDASAATNRLHVGFAAPSREHVDAFWQAGVDAGFADDGSPGPRPQYVEDYYGAFLRSPDGNSIEAVYYSTVPNRTGFIDHVWIRVADLDASTAFYRIVADAAGLELRRATADRTTVGGPGGGGVSLVPGEPTHHVHMAFAGDNAAVDRFHASLIAAGYEDNGAPGERPEYHPGYYAAYVLDPDGNNIEVVNHNRS
jgi:catechol 2,3-dioxygenase-like lactoylglutathione lyase family enzyme